jgi:hypothetical protein
MASVTSVAGAIFGDISLSSSSSGRRYVDEEEGGGGCREVRTPGPRPPIGKYEVRSVVVFVN